MTRTRKPREPKWITRARKALDEVEKMDPNDPSLAPFRTKNWIRKGEGMVAGLKPIACLVIMLAMVAGCTRAQWAAWAPSGGAHSTTYIDGRAITTYHYPAPDPLGSVHEFRPDIYYRMFPR